MKPVRKARTPSTKRMEKFRNKRASAQHYRHILGEAFLPQATQNFLRVRKESISTKGGSFIISRFGSRAQQCLLFTVVRDTNQVPTKLQNVATATERREQEQRRFEHFHCLWESSKLASVNLLKEKV